jgi:delta 1-pyrroline-5-carboxylate dehydrogenase
MTRCGNMWYGTAWRTTNDLLAYLVRRLLENGANSSFLKQ